MPCRILNGWTYVNVSLQSQNDFRCVGVAHYKRWIMYEEMQRDRGARIIIEILSSLNIPKRKADTIATKFMKYIVLWSIR